MGNQAHDLLHFTSNQAVPINKGRYSMDLQPFTHVVIHQAWLPNSRFQWLEKNPPSWSSWKVVLKTLNDPSAFSTARYWRLAALFLKPIPWSCGVMGLVASEGPELARARKISLGLGTHLRCVAEVFALDLFKVFLHTSGSFASMVALGTAWAWVGHIKTEGSVMSRLAAWNLSSLLSCVEIEPLLKDIWDGSVEARTLATEQLLRSQYIDCQVWMLG